MHTSWGIFNYLILFDYLHLHAKVAHLIQIFTAAYLLFVKVNDGICCHKFVHGARDPRDFDKSSKPDSGSNNSMTKSERMCSIIAGVGTSPYHSLRDIEHTIVILNQLTTFQQYQAAGARSR